MHELLRPAGVQMFGTRAWRSPAVVGGDGIEPPTSTELAEHDPKPLKTSGLVRFGPPAISAVRLLFGGKADVAQTTHFGSD